MTNEEWIALRARMDADCARVSEDVARGREKRKATKKPRKMSLKKYMASENECVRKDGTP
jgi:hypothetical protein